MSSSGSSGSGSHKPTPAAASGKDGGLSKIPMAPAAASTSSASSSSSSSRVLRARKENVIPAAGGGGSSSSVNSGSGQTAAAAQLFATKDIDRIAKYKADRRKAIYLRNTVQENENERLEIKKRSSSRSTANTPTSSAIHSKSQSSAAHHSKAPSSSSTTSTSIASRPWMATAAASSSRSAPSSTSNVTKLVPHHGSTRPTAAGAANGGGSLPLSPSHQPKQRKPRDRSSTARPVTSSVEEKQVVPAATATQQVKQPPQQQPQQPIRTTRSSRLRAAALEKDRVSEDTLQSFGQPRLKVLPSGGGNAKLSSSSSSNSTNNTTSSSQRISPNISSSSSLNAGSRLKPTKPRLVPTIAVNMKQKLKATSETIATIKVDFNRNGGAATGSSVKISENGDLLNGNEVESEGMTLKEPVEPMNNNVSDVDVEPEQHSEAEVFLEQIPSTTTAANEGTPAGILRQQRPQLSSVGSLSSLDSPRTLNSPRMRTSTMKSGVRNPLAGLEVAFPKDDGSGPLLSPVKSNKILPVVVAGGGDLLQRDKSAKRKSNLNRSQHEEATEKRPSSTERRRRQKSGSAPLSSPEPVTTKSTGLTRKTARQTTKQQPPSEKITSSLSSIPSTATTTPASSPYPPKASLQSSTTSLAAPSSTPSTPSKFSPLLVSSKTPSPALSAAAKLQHSSSSSTTLAGEVATTSTNRLDDVSNVVDSRIAGGGSEPDVAPDSPLVQQYSKFSQIMLKSPTLEKCVREEEPEVEVPLLATEQQQQQELVPLDEEEAADNVIVIEDDSRPEMDLDMLEAGPSGLCPVETIDLDDDDEAEEEQQKEGGEVKVVQLRRPSNRILFDDKFNDEFVVIENSPKSHFIQSLDETDIIVIGDNDEDYPPRPASSNSAEYRAESKKLVKMSSVEHFESLHHQRKSCSPQRKKSLSPIMRAKSMEESALSSVAGSPGPSNHIVSILKRKTVESNSSASSNASPVTFSPSVVDTPVRSNRRQGILKKRCSLDESRYSRSHSPDDRSILVKHTRRNSFEDSGSTSNQQHGILKQKSYESKEDVSSATTCCGSTTAVNSVVQHGILKKKTDSSSTSTPNEQPKHVSISQAVILAAAEICQDMLLDDHEHDQEIRPILKSDSQPLPTPKPILKKKYSSESEEIRPILKSSRKSSREENSDSEELKRSILKTDSPAKRRSFGDRSDSVDSNGTNAALIRSRSLEHPEQIPTAPVVPQVQNIEKPIISVAERIKNMEKFLAGPSTSASGSGGCSSVSSSGAIPKRNNAGGAMSRRESFRFKTQPVTSSEISGVQQQVDRSSSEQNPEESYSSLESSSCNAPEPEDCSLPPQTEPEPSSSCCPRGSLESLASSSGSHKDRSHLPVTQHVSEEPLSPTLGATESNSHSISGEFNLASLSSDSGIQFGRGTEETSGADYVSSSVKTSDSEKSPSKKTIDDDLNDLEEEEEDEHLLQIIEEPDSGRQRLLLSPSSAARSCCRRVRAGSNCSNSSSSTSSSDLSDRECGSMYTATASTQQGQGQAAMDDLDDSGSSGLHRSNSVRARANMFQQLESRMKENENPANPCPRGRRVMPAAQFTTQTISPTDIERSHHHPHHLHHNTSNLSSSNKQDVSDDSGTEFDPSTLQVSKKIKLFSGGGVQATKGTPPSFAATATSTTTASTTGITTTPRSQMGPVKKKAIKFRTIGKLIMPKFLNDNNNNISNSSPTLGDGIEERKEEKDEMQEEEEEQLSMKVERLRRKFMGDMSSPVIVEGDGPTTYDEGSDSNVESGKENNYDSGGEYGVQVTGSGGGIAALKKNLLNGNRSHNKSILLNSTGEVEEVVIKGKVSTMAKQWNRLRAMTLDVSAIRTPSASALHSPVNDHNATCDRPFDSLPFEVDSEHFQSNNTSLLEKSSFHQQNKSKQRNSPQIDERFAKYFGVKNQNPTSPATPTLITPNASIADSNQNKMRRRSRSMPRGNPPAPPPQRPIGDRIAKYFGVNKSFSGSAGSISPQTQGVVNKPRAIVKPQQRLVNPDPIFKHLNLLQPDISAPKGRRRSRSVPQEDFYDGDNDEWRMQQEKAAAKLQHASSFCGGSSLLKPLRTFEEFNLTAEDLSMADSEFDKLYID